MQRWGWEPSGKEQSEGLESAWGYEGPRVLPRPFKGCDLVPPSMVSRWCLKTSFDLPLAVPVQGPRGTDTLFLYTIYTLHTSEAPVFTLMSSCLYAPISDQAL